jgi:trans-aconitate 2-methyltransferase
LCPAALLAIIACMASPSWDPDQYRRYSAERSRPFHDLVGQITTVAPHEVTDLGCGPGTLTATLAQRWPQAYVHGIDASPEMIREAQPLAEPGRLGFSLGRIEEWQPEPESVDVIVSNAALQWVPSHLDLLPVWAAALRPGGCLAIQMPAMGGSPATAVFRTVAMSKRWADRMGSVSLSPGPRSGASPVRTMEEYADVLARLGLRVNAWQTTYLHLLPGDDPALEWFAGTGLRPYLDALADDVEALAQFRADIAAGLREAYPRMPYGTVMPFRRVFVVAGKDYAAGS